MAILINSNGGGHDALLYLFKKGFMKTIFQIILLIIFFYVVSTGQVTQALYWGYKSALNIAKALIQ